jgi:tetratricopeptide (TPR) repeat protein
VSWLNKPAMLQDRGTALENGTAIVSNPGSVMDLPPEQFARLEQLFSEAIELSPPLRAALLARVREEQGAVTAEQLRVLLAAQSERTESLFQPLVKPELLLAESRLAFKAGDLILKRFRIIRLLGRGGMGEVYEAQDAEIGRVALKTIREDVRGDRSFIRRFKQEVQLARMVTNPYVCRIHELFTLPAEGNRPAMAFLTMEFLEGVTLADRVAIPGPLFWRDAESVALQLCQGLEAIHSAGIVHRDFKSRNVMLTTHKGAPRAVVMDLGLARRSGLADATQNDSALLTLAGAIMGTPDYMAPEQFEGGMVSAATDIYAFGVMLYEMVTGKRPFEASTPMAAAVRRAKRPPSASSIQPGVPHRWDAVIEKCLEYEPEKRYQSVNELACALQRPSALTATLRAVMAEHRGPRRIGLLLVGLGLLAAVLLGFKWYRIQAAHKVPDAARTFYRKATEAFQNGNYLTTTRELQEAVKLDPDFVLAHARLADAFSELDLTGDAQREVNQIKEELVSQLSSTQQTYVHAVRNTVRPDANAAVHDYEKLLNSTETPMDRANALVDLGRADERAGKIGDATQRYSQAVLLDPYSPTPFLRRGILESRDGKQKAADADFAEANKLYGTNINLEGAAEVDYQRSYVASKLGPSHEREAREFFQESLDKAEKMHSVALQVRALSRLSAIEFGADHDEEAGKVANDAIRLAEENGIAYWATDARLRLGNSWIYRDVNEAEKSLERARVEAQRNQWPRLQALSELSLASLAERQQTRQRQQQTIDLALPAYEYYRTFGFAQESFQCQVLLSWAKSFFGLFTESLQHAEKALEVANNLASPTELFQAQEAIGSTLYAKEDYPAALEHLTSAFHIAEGMPIAPLRAHYMSVEALMRAEALCRLGRIEEAKLAVAAVSNGTWRTDSRVRFDFVHLQAALLKSQGRYQEALLLAQRAFREGANAGGEHWDIQLMVADGLTRTGSATKALALCEKILAQAGEQSPIVVAEAKLVKARGLLELRQWQPAIAMAEESGLFFRASGLKESQLVSLWITARSYREAGSAGQAKAATREIQDILSDFKHYYGTDNYQLFVRRSEMADVVSDVGQQEISSRGNPPNRTERMSQ